MKRTQEEILKRFNKVDDIFGTQKGDLIACMPFDAARPFLNEEYVEEVEQGKETWEQSTDPVKEILDYLPFAYGKAEGERGLSANRSILHMITWIWLTGDEEFYEKVNKEWETNYHSYGIDILDMISEKYGFEK